MDFKHSLLKITYVELMQAVTSLVFYNLMLVAIVISSLVSSILVSFLVKREGEAFGIRHIPMEFHSPKKELILLACVHSPQMVATTVGLIESLRGSESVPISPYLMHLIEIPDKAKENSKDYGHQEDELSDEDGYGADDAVEINEAVDIFTAETKMTIHQVKNVSPYLRMCQDVCDFVEDIRSSIVILPFHKHQRIDGKLENDKESIRRMNLKILRHAPCSVALLIDRGHTAKASHVAGSESLNHVATLFFGGPDDREALGLSKRLSTHHHTNLTIIRFLKTSIADENLAINVARKGDEVLVSEHNTGAEIDAKDSAALKKFYNRYF